ncbi:MAG: 6-pyruvoyl-tetrahydropterin synthase-related protein [Chloroflexi bacterium]|nr:6-pyruvoyl-tetrahydropterin synthase-related protein [Chloroflexota bacterium]
MRLTFSGGLRRFFDPGLALAIVLTFVVARPIWGADGLGYGGDKNAYAFRAAEMRRSWEHGEFLPSWAETTYWGYGSPAFHFNGNLSYHITSATQLIFNINVVQAVRWLMLLSVMLAGVATYLFCRRRSGALGALIAGLIYVNSPYFLFINAGWRGNFPDLFIQALFPLLLWRIDALRDAPTARNFLLVVLIEVALFNTHQSAPLYIGIAFAWLGFEGLVQRINREASQLGFRGEAWAALALLLGALLAASFLFPFLLERDTVTHGRLLGENGIWQLRSLEELLKIPQNFYTIERPPQKETFHIGIAQWTYALAGAAGSLALYVRGYRSRHPNAFLAALFFFGLALALIVLFQPWTRSLWLTFSPLRYAQFPMRLLAPIALCCAYLSSLNGLWLQRLPGRAQLPVTALAVAAVVVAGFALSRTMILTNEESDFSAKRLLTTVNVSTTAFDEFFPITASKDVDKTRLLADYVNGYPIDKFDHESLPPGASATLLRNQPEAHAWRVSSATPFEATILNYWWHGWAATVDGRPAPVAPTTDLGLISVSLPAGDYTLRVYLGSTPARDVGAWISALALIASLALAWRLRRLGIAPRPYASSRPMSIIEVRGVLLGGAIIALFFYIVFF